MSAPTIRQILSEGGHAPQKIRKSAQITDALAARVVEMRNDGLRVPYIAKECEITESSVRGILFDHAHALRGYRKGSVSPEEFVKVWQNAESAYDVARVLGMPLRAVLSRARTYRAKGVPLKQMPAKPPESYSYIDWEELATIARRMADDEIDE